MGRSPHVALCILALTVFATGQSFAADWAQDTEASLGDLTSATIKHAPDGTKDDRTTIGVGEYVKITFDPSTWKDTDCNKTTGNIEDDTIGTHAWACTKGGTVMALGDTSAKLTGGYDDGDPKVTLKAADSGTKFVDGDKQGTETRKWAVRKTIQFKVIKPTGEDTVKNGWDTTYPSMTLFKQTLKPGNVNFSYIKVIEKDGAGSSDGCWFAKSKFGKYQKLSGGTWDVSQTNEWASDHCGWFEDRIAYYLKQNRAPCHTTLAQEMHIFQAPGVKYFSDTITEEIGQAGVTNTRNGVSDTKNYAP